jgi:hypothetical protein
MVCAKEAKAANLGIANPFAPGGLLQAMSSFTAKKLDDRPVSRHS